MLVQRTSSLCLKCAILAPAWVDSNFYISKSCSAVLFWLHNIKQISKFLARDKLEIVLHAFVTSRIDYCNGLLYGLPNCEITKLQRVQNAADSLLTSSRKFDHITPVLKELYWLPVRYRIHFKILLLTFKALKCKCKCNFSTVSCESISSYK